MSTRNEAPSDGRCKEDDGTHGQHGVSSPKLQAAACRGQGEHRHGVPGSAMQARRRTAACLPHAPASTQLPRAPTFRQVCMFSLHLLHAYSHYHGCPLPPTPAPAFKVGVHVGVQRGGRGRQPDAPQRRLLPSVRGVYFEGARRGAGVQDLRGRPQGERVENDRGTTQRASEAASCKCKPPSSDTSFVRRVTLSLGSITPPYLAAPPAPGTCSYATASPARCTCRRCRCCRRRRAPPQPRSPAAHACREGQQDFLSV